MRALIQRVSRASVKVDEQVVGQISQGLLVLLGVGQDDNEVQVKALADKIVNCWHLSQCDWGHRLLPSAVIFRRCRSKDIPCWLL
jgi:D-Tyr-tRNAtyr deacylase